MLTVKVVAPGAFTGPVGDALAVTTMSAIASVPLRVIVKVPADFASTLGVADVTVTVVGLTVVPPTPGAVRNATVTVDVPPAGRVSVLLLGSTPVVPLKKHWIPFAGNAGQANAKVWA